MNKPQFIECLYPVLFEPHPSNSGYETAIWIDKDYWLEEFDGKPDHVVVPSCDSVPWETNDITYWVPFEHKGADYLHEFDVPHNVLIKCLGKNHPCLRSLTSWEDDNEGNPIYSTDTLELLASDFPPSKQQLLQIMHEVMRTGSYKGMRCLSITNPYFHADCFNAQYPLDLHLDNEIPHKEYILALGLDPARTHVKTHWTGG